MNVKPDLYFYDDSLINVKRAAGAHKIASFMRSQGWDIEVLDYWLAFDFLEFKEFIRSRVTDKTVFIGISNTFPLSGSHLITANLYIEWIKQNYDIPVVAGSKNYYVTRDMNVDYHLTGYGEYGLIELTKKLLGKQNNVVIDGNIVHCDIHHPCYPQKDLTVKYEDRDFLLPSEVLTLEFSRGCKFACKFCSYNVIGVRGDYTRDMPSLYDELKYNYDKYGIQDYVVADETVNDSTEKLKAIAEQVKRLPFKPNMAGYVRGDLIVAREDDRKYMEEMGLWSHYYGIESLNHKAAKTIGKGMHPDKIKQGMLDVRDYFGEKYRHTFSMIVGLPYETKETLIDGLQWHLDNFPEQSVVMFPLYLQNLLEVADNKTSQSEFDRTWRTSGDFHSQTGTDESFGSDKNLLSEEIRDIVWNNYKNSNGLYWSHDTFNWWSANKLWGELLISDYMLNRGIVNWNLYNFVSAGTYTWEEALKLKNTNYDQNKLKEDIVDHIEDYKWKKLSL